MRMEKLTDNMIRFAESKLGYKEIKHDEESVFYIKYRVESS